MTCIPLNNKFIQSFTGAAVLSSALTAGSTLAHEDHCTAVRDSVSAAGFADSVTVECDGEFARIISNTYPDHEVMTGIVATNEQTAVPARFAAPVPLSPQLGDAPQTRDAALGVAVNGVPIYDYTAGGEMSQADLQHHQTRHDTFLTQQLDFCGGHAGRGDDYHYHVKPRCMIDQMKNAGDDAIIGWAFDGFPIYGDKNPDGSTISESALDVCNGQEDTTFGYRYHSTESAPCIVQCLMGEIESFDSLPRVRPLKSMTGGPGKKAGKPPRDGVENLVFTEEENGARRLQYTYEDEDYYIEYSSSDTENCYQFKTRTITNNGSVESGKFCRN